MKMDNEKIERTKKFLNEGLKAFVSLLIISRHDGLIATSREIKVRIDTIITNNDLDRDMVYFCYGDPDDPTAKGTVYKNALKQQMVIK